MVLRAMERDFPVIQWLRLRAPSAGGPDLAPGQGTRSHMPQLKDLLCSATKTRFSQKKKKKKKRAMEKNRAREVSAASKVGLVVKNSPANAGDMRLGFDS